MDKLCDGIVTNMGYNMARVLKRRTLPVDQLPVLPELAHLVALHLQNHRFAVALVKPHYL